MNTKHLNPVSVLTFAGKKNASRHPLLVFGLIIFVVSPVRAGEPAVVPSALETDPDGWIDIMPPADLEGWSRVPVPPGGELGRAQWHVDADKGLLICDGDGGHDMLLTEKEYGDAIFHFEFRYTKVEGKEGYNSGAYVRNSKDGAVWHQAQFGDARDGFLFGVTPTTEGKTEFFTLRSKVKDGRVKPAGQWNTMEVTASGKTLTLWINGAVTCEFENCGISRGHIGFEGEGYRVEFRNLKVKKLPERAEEEVAGQSPMKGDQPDREGQESWRVFVGRWDIGAPDPPGGPPFVMTLNEDFSAKKSHVPAATGKWEYAGGEARVTWSDGWRDILRRDGNKFRKIAFRPGTTFDSPPDNTASAVKKTADQARNTRLHVGWARADITPDKPVGLIGFGRRRISQGVKDPIAATALALESVGLGGEVAEQAIMVSCDLISIRKSTMESVRKLLKERLPDFDSDKVLLCATHTHQAPQQQSGTSRGIYALTAAEKAKGWMTGDDYGDFLAQRVAEAAVKAWKSRKPGGVSWAIDQAVVGYNRRFVYLDGSAKMMGGVNTPGFDCVEGVEDHSLSLLFFWDADRKLTGMIINVASPAQSEQGGNLISADFWHDVREEIAGRHSKEVFVFPQCGAAGEGFPQSKIRGRAESTMAQRKGITWRREIALRIADGVDRALPVARKFIETAVVFKHTVARIDLPEKDPPALPFATVDSVKPAEFHMLRLGDVAMVTCPFELFIDYGMRIRARSKALMTFVVQLSCGHSEYLPTTRAIRGGGYSAELYLVGPKGGHVLVDESVERINALWP